MTRMQPTWNPTHAVSLIRSLAQDPDGCLLEATGFDGQDHLEGAGSGADAQPAASVAAAQAGASFKSQI